MKRPLWCPRISAQVRKDLWVHLWAKPQQATPSAPWQRSLGPAFRRLPINVRDYLRRAYNFTAIGGGRVMGLVFGAAGAGETGGYFGN